MSSNGVRTSFSMMIFAYNSSEQNWYSQNCKTRELRAASKHSRLHQT